MTAARRRRRRRNRVYWLLLLVLVAVAVGVGYKVWDEYFREDNAGEIVEGGDTKKPKEVPSDDNTGEAVDDSDSEPGETEEEIPPAKPQYDGPDPNVGEGITGVITYAGASDGVLMIRVNIDQYLAGGSCELALARDGAALYSEIAGVIDSAATSTCEGFNVPVTRIGSGGKVGIRILVTSGERSGIIEGEADL